MNKNHFKSFLEFKKLNEGNFLKESSQYLIYCFNLYKDFNIYKNIFVKIPKKNTEKSLESIKLGLSKLGGYAPKTSIFENLELNVANKQRKVNYVVIQEELLDFLTSLSYNNQEREYGRCLDLIYNLFETEKNIQELGLVYPDPFFSNYAVDENLNVYLHDFGTLTNQLEGSNNFSHPYFKPEEEDNYETFLNNLGFVLYERLNKLKSGSIKLISENHEPLEKGILEYFIRMSKLDPHEEILKLEIDENDFKRYSKKIINALKYNNKKQNDSIGKINNVSLIYNIANEENKRFIENIIIANKYNDEFQSFGRLFLENFSKNSDKDYFKVEEILKFV